MACLLAWSYFLQQIWRTRAVATLGPVPTRLVLNHFNGGCGENRVVHRFIKLFGHFAAMYNILKSLPWSGYFPYTVCHLSRTSGNSVIALMCRSLRRPIGSRASFILIGTYGESNYKPEHDNISNITCASSYDSDEPE